MLESTVLSRMNDIFHFLIKLWRFHWEYFSSWFSGTMHLDIWLSTLTFIFFSLFCFQPIFWQMALLIGWCKENGHFISKVPTLFVLGINIPNQNRTPVWKVLLFRPTYQQTLQFWTKKSKYSFVFWCFGDNFVQIVIFIAFMVQTMAPLWLAHNFSWLYYPSTGIKANFSV